MAMEEALIKRVLPHSDEAERAVVGSMLMDQDAIVTASEIVSGDDFYQRQYGILFDVMTELYREDKPVDLVTLQERMKSKDVPPELTSVEFISGIVNDVPTSANVKHYAETVAEKALLRRMIKTNEEIANTCYLGKEPVDQILETTEKKIFDLLQKKGADDYINGLKMLKNEIGIIRESISNGNLSNINDSVSKINNIRVENHKKFR